MPVYTGSTKYPYALTVNYGGVTSNASAVSENIQPIVVDSSTLYQFTAVLSMSATWSSGATITVTYYNSGGGSLGSVTATQAAMAGGTVYTLSTTAGVAPANTSYAVLNIQLNGAPATTSTLSILQAGLYNTNNPNLDYEVNQNAAFANGFQPWTAGNNGQLGWTWNPLQVADGNFDSMLLAGIVELIGGPGGVPTDIPELVDSSGVGAIFRLLAPPTTNSVAFGYEMSYDLGAPQPTTDVVESLLLDGERPFGYRASNRTITLPIIIEGTSQAIVQAAREYLMMLVDQQIWKLTWTPASNGLPLVFDCFRASPTVVSYGFNYNRDPQAGAGGLAYTVMTLSFQAMPYAHSGVDGTKDLAFSSQLVSGKAQASAYSIDNFTTVSGAGWSKDARWSNAPYIFNDLETGTNNTNISTSNTAPTVSDPGITAFTSVHTGVSSTAQFSNTHAAHGTLSAKFNTAGSSEATYVEWDETAANQEWFRFYLYMTANPSAVTTLWYAFSSAGAAQAAKIRVNSTGNLVGINSTGSTLFTSTSTVALNQWVRVEGYVIGSATNGQLSMSYYATADSTTATETKTSTLGQNTAGTLNIFKIGAVETTALNFTFWMDDVALSTQGPIGPYSPFGAVSTTSSALGTAAHFTPPRPLQQPYPAATYTGAVLGNGNLAGLTSVNWWFGQAYDYAYGHDPTFRSTVVFRWTLTDVNGHTLKFSKTFSNVKWSKNSSTPAWSRMSVPIPQGSTTFNYSNVNTYSVTFSNHSSGGKSGYIKMHAWLSNLQGLPETISNNPGTPRGNIFNIFGAPGSARSPISVQAQLPTQTGNVVTELTKSGTWKVPQGVYSLQAECWGGGGAGGSTSLGGGVGRALGGGGGGEYAAEPSISVVPGTLIPYTIGAGGTAGPLVNTVNTFNDPGVGHWICPAGVSSIQVECWGAGAAGSAGGGGGGGGEYAKEASVTVTPGKTYIFAIGKPGVPNTGKSSAYNGARDGASTIFYGITNTVTAHGGKSPATGGTLGGNGGTGSTNTVHFNGGNGGKAPGAAGGGGGASAGSGGRGPNGAVGARGNNVGQGAHLTGGVGGSGGGVGGANGGAGANAPGFPAAGGTGGGGGGGGYNNGGRNYKGGLGGNGQVKISYQVNLGTPVNGGNTTFGAASLTNLTVTANGGTSVGNNTFTGGAGGTGSSNSTHFAGGSGYPISAGTNANGLVGAGSTTFVNQQTFSFNSTSATSSAATHTVSQGIQMVAIMAASAVTDLTVTDNAGNIYEQQSSVAAGSGTLYVFTGYIAASVINGTTTLTVSSATSQQYAVSWNYVVNGLEVNTANIATGTGTSTNPAVTLGNTDTTTSEMNVIFTGNSSTVARTGTTGTGSDETLIVTTAEVAGGALEIACAIGLSPPDTSGRGSLGLNLASSTTWGAISIPIVVPNQGAAPASLLSTFGAEAWTGTSTAVTPRFTFNTLNTGVIVILVQRPATSTVSATDAGGNTYTAQVTASNGASSSFLTVLTAPVAHATGTITVADTVNQAHNMKAFYVAGAVACDTAGNATGSGTTSVALSSGAPTYPTDFTIFAGFTAGVNISSNTGTGTALLNFNNVSNNSMNMDITAVFNQGNSASSATATTTASTAIGMAAVSLKIPWFGGGGGGSAGTLGIGYPGFDTGGISPSNGGLGATGPQATSAGIQGGAPGGGGSGAMTSAGGTVIGGAGGNGRVRLTYAPPLPSFDNLILHMPGYNSPDTFNPVSPIPPLDPPDGREYTMQSLVPWRNAEFNGTYAVFLVNYNWSHAVSTNVTRRVTVTLTQYEYAGGPGYSMQVTRLITPATDVINGIISLGNLPLPIKQYDDSNEEPYYTYSVISSASGDRFMDILFLDTTGETVLINVSNSHPAFGSYANYYIDEPDFDTDISPVLGSPQGPERAVSILDSTIMSGGPFFLVPGDNFLLAYSTYGAPNIGVRYNPRWYTDRVKF